MSTKDPGLIDVGVHCFACGRLDFLPFKCTECSHSYCGEHRKSHNCTNVMKPAAKPAEYNGAKSTSQAGVRLGGSPAAIKLDAAPVRASPPARNDLTRKCLEKAKSHPVGSIAAFSRLRASFPCLEKSKLRFGSAATLNPMLEIKKNAKGDEKIPVQNRVYFYLHWPGNKTRQSITRPVFYNKTLVVGKLLDMACESLDLSVKDKFSEGNKVSLFIDKERLEPGKKLGDIAALKGKNPVTISIRV